MHEHEEQKWQIFIIQELIGGLLGYMLARGIGGGMIPRRREEKRKREERARGMKHMASDLGTLGYCIPKLMESRAHQSASLVPLCFAQKQAAGIVLDSSTLRDGSRLDSNRGQYGEKRRRKEGKNEVGEKKGRRQGREEEERMVADVGPEEPRENGLSPQLCQL